MGKQEKYLKISEEVLRNVGGKKIYKVLLTVQQDLELF